MARKPLDVVGTSGPVGKHDFKPDPLHLRINVSPELTKALKLLMERPATSGVMREAFDSQAIAKRAADDFYSINPRYRTKEKLAEMIEQAILGRL